MLRELSFNKLFSSNMSIQRQVIIFMIIGFSLMTMMISLATSTGVNQQYRSLMLENAEQITEGLAKRAVFPLLSGSEQNAQEAIDQVLGFEQVLSARLLHENNEIFLTTHQFPTLKQSNSSTAQSLIAQSTLTQSRTRKPSTNHLISHTIISLETPEYWLIKSPVFINNDQDSADESELELGSSELSSSEISNAPIGYAELVYSKSYLNQAQFQIAVLIAGLGILSVLLLSLILKTGLKKLFTPLGTLADTMLKAEESGEHLQAEVNGAKEVRNMATAYNSMMRVLDEQDETLKRHRDSLEKEVYLRTKELVIARDEAVNASQHKSEFIANMSHELRTPIQSIIGYGELVVEELELDGNFELIEDMDKITKNSQRLLLMINSLLDLAKIESGKIDLNEVSVSLSELQNNIIDTITPLAHNNDNSFSLIDHTGIYGFVADKEKLEQVLLNLLSNACKFSKNDSISLTISNTDHDISFSVKDNGIGLSEEQQQYIFDEFRQVDASQSRKFSGTGLGLAISKRFIDLMRGEIVVESELDKGATFTITLPLK